ncbi:MAG: peptide chain release factor N(5)-glutamine methyltransferase [Spirochaetia bacterium]|jgi:release factor glutamine methyltransferase|nr:peptide chain release factor N(5)-glutamine methyltransferase [Spirochaetia bacterium]
MTVKEIITQTAEKISQRWPFTPFLDASILLQEASGMSREKLLASYNTEIDENILEIFTEMEEKRVSGYPVAYITGRKEFFSNTYHVDRSVLIPRPDTEILVEKVLEAAEKMIHTYGDPLKILDLCTGSGCIAITLKKELGSRVEVEASDISEEAEKTFNINCKEILGYCIPFYRCSLFDGIKGKYNIIASNPPYLEDTHVDKMIANNWPEPESALRGGADGLDLIRKIAPAACSYMENDGKLFLEADPGQIAEVKRLFSLNRFSSIEISKDLSGKERVISGCLK